MKPKKIILIRHGESEGNVDERVYGNKPDYTLELTDDGIKKSEAVGLRLVDDLQLGTYNSPRLFFYVSPLWRTRTTFECIARQLPRKAVAKFAGKEPKIGDLIYEWREEPRLREQEWGHLRDVPECNLVNLERDAYGTFYYRIPDGESAADVYDRVSDFLNTMYRDFQNPDYPDYAIMVTHGMTIRLFLMRFFHWTVEEFETYGNPENCDMVVLTKNRHDKYDLETKLKTRPAKTKFQRPISI